MCASGKQAEHTNCISRIDGLVENLVVDDHDGVGSEDRIVWALLGDGQSLFARQALGAVFCFFSGERVFVDVRGLNFKGNVGIAKKFLTSRGGGGENEHEITLNVG